MSLKTVGAICRQASQSMHVESTKKSPSTLSGIRRAVRAMRLAVRRWPLAVKNVLGQRTTANGQRIILSAKAIYQADVRQPPGQNGPGLQDPARRSQAQRMAHR